MIIYMILSSELTEQDALICVLPHFTMPSSGEPTQQDCVRAGSGSMGIAEKGRAEVARRRDA
jgi:hypothetical protein